MKRWYFSVFLTFALLGTAQAESPYKGDFYMALGVYFPTVSTTASLDASDGSPGTDIDLEQVLGVDDTDTSGLVEFHYKFNERHGIGLSYFSLNRNGSKILDGTIEWGDTVYDVGAAVQSEFNSKTYRIYYDYAFLLSSKYSLSASIGLHVTEFELKLQALAAIDGEPIAGTAESTSVSAPLPVFGLRGAYRLSDNWLLKGKAEYFQLKVDNTDGSIANFGLGVQYDGFKNIVLGFDYDYFDINVAADDKGRRAELDYAYHGPMLTIGTYF